MHTPETGPIENEPFSYTFYLSAMQSRNICFLEAHGFQILFLETVQILQRLTEVNKRMPARRYFGAERPRPYVLCIEATRLTSCETMVYVRLESTNCLRF